MLVRVSNPLFDDACAQQKTQRLRTDATQAVKVLIRICMAVMQAWLDWIVAVERFCGVSRGSINVYDKCTQSQLATKAAACMMFSNFAVLGCSSDLHAV